MIDVRFVIAHSLWILGVSVGVAAFSYYEWWARESGRRRSILREAPGCWISLASGVWLAASGVLLLYSTRPWHRGVWMAVSAIAAIGLWVVWRRIPHERVAIAAASVARVVVAAELPVIIALSPALLFPTPERLIVLAAIPIIWLCAWILGGRVIPRTPLNTALWLMLVMVGVSLHATVDVLYSLLKIAGVILGVLLYWAIARWLATDTRLKVGVALFLLAGAALAILGLLGVFWMDKYPAIAAVTSKLPMVIRGVPGAEEGFNPNALAGCLVLFIPLQVALLAAGVHRWVFPIAKTRQPGSWLVVIQTMLLALTAGTTMLTQSRSAWAGLFVAFAAFLVWQRRLTLVLATVVLTAAVVAGAALGMERAIGLATRVGGADVTQRASIRLELWSRSIHAIQDFPLAGIGMNGFRKIMPTNYPATDRGKSTIHANTPHAHNHLLQAALDLGLPGLVAYLSIWMVTAALLVSVYRRSGERIYRAIAGGLGAGLIAHFIFGVADAIPLGAKVGVLFWLTLALTAGLHRVAFARPPD